MYELRVVRERREGYGSDEALTTSSRVYAAFKSHFARADREQFVVVLLNGKNRLIGFEIVSVGSLTASLVHPREVFKVAILANAAAIIVAHNHPSGDPTPSAEDMAITNRLKQAGELLGISVLDHVVIGDGRYVSFADENLL